MTKIANPPGLAAGAGTSLLGGSDSPAIISNRAAAQAQRPVCPIVLGCQRRLVSDLLAESIEIAIAFNLSVLSAIRTADDEAVIEAFRRADAAHRTARQCATELRSLLEAGVAQ